MTIFDHHQDFAWPQKLPETVGNRDHNNLETLSVANLTTQIPHFLMGNQALLPGACWISWCYGSGPVQR